MCQQTVLRFCISLRETFSNSIAFTVINKYGKGAGFQISIVFGPVYHVARPRIFSNRTFYTFILPRLSQSIISEIHRVWRSSKFWKSSKFNLRFKNAEKNSEKVFCFLDNYIWIGCTKLSILRREYLSSAANVLTNSPKILHITKRNFFQLNCLHSDQ